MRETAILLQFLATEPHFVRKGCDGNPEIAILPQFLAVDLISCERVVRREAGNRNFTPVFGDRTSFRAKGLRREAGNRNFTAVFGDRTSFRAKGLRFVPSRWHCPAPSREK